MAITCRDYKTVFKVYEKFAAKAREPQAPIYIVNVKNLFASPANGWRDLNITLMFKRGIPQGYVAEVRVTLELLFPARAHPGGHQRHSSARSILEV